MSTIWIWLRAKCAHCLCHAHWHDNFKCCTLPTSGFTLTRVNPRSFPADKSQVHKSQREVQAVFSADVSGTVGRLYEAYLPPFWEGWHALNCCPDLATLFGAQQCIIFDIFISGDASIGIRYLCHFGQHRDGKQLSGNVGCSLMVYRLVCRLGNFSAGYSEGWLVEDK